MVQSLFSGHSVAFDVMRAWRRVRDVNSKMLEASVSNYLAVNGDSVICGVDDARPLVDQIDSSERLDYLRFLRKVKPEIFVVVNERIGGTDNLPKVNVTLAAGCRAPCCVSDCFLSIQVNSEENQIGGHTTDVVSLVIVNASVLIVHRVYL